MDKETNRQNVLKIYFRILTLPIFSLAFMMIYFITWLSIDNFNFSYKKIVENWVKGYDIMDVFA